MWFWSGLVLSQSRRLRLLLILVLYINQGLPMGLFWFAIPAWLAANGASTGDVAYLLAMTALPWSLKILNGLLVDRYTLLTMGRRRVWIIGAQVLMVVLLVASGCLDLGPSDVRLLGAVAFVVNVAASFQDVAVDGLAVDLFGEEERARGGGLMFGGQAIGVSVATAVGGGIVVAHGASAAFFLLALVLAVLSTVMIVCRERPSEKLLPWTRGRTSLVNHTIQAGSWGQVLKGTLIAMLRPASLVYSLFPIFRGLQYGLLSAVTPQLAAHFGGWSAREFGGSVGLAQLTAGIVGMTVGGYFGDRIGPRWASAAVLCGWILLLFGMSYGESAWDNADVLIGFIIAWITLDVLITVTTLPIAMRLCDPTVAATQFTSYMVLGNGGMAIGAALTGLTSGVSQFKFAFFTLGLANVAAMVIIIFARFPGSKPT